MSVNPKVITTPKVAAMAKDGIQLLALARVTVRANINRLVGGAGEETILARVGEGIVSTIGSAESHKKVLENPDMISKSVLAKGLDAGTAFEILSIDIADVDVGKNIGALAVAMEQEFKAEAQKQRASVIAAEAQIPLAMAEAFRSGNLGIMDYHLYRNVQADTTMRQAIAGQGDSTPAPAPETAEAPPAAPNLSDPPRSTARSDPARGKPAGAAAAGAGAKPRAGGSHAGTDGDQLPAPPLPDDEDVEERTSLEEPEKVSLEQEVHRPARVTQDHDSEAEEVVRRRIAAAEARDGALTKVDHTRFDTRIRQEPADHTAVRRYTPAQVRDAIVWREILGPPVSGRDS